MRTKKKNWTPHHKRPNLRTFPSMKFQPLSHLKPFSRKFLRLCPTELGDGPHDLGVVRENGEENAWMPNLGKEGDKVSAGNPKVVLGPKEGRGGRGSRGQSQGGRKDGR